jgi:RimJ/RimL family protein N-acetyltransferase
MDRFRHSPGAVTLAAVDEALLTQLSQVAFSEASANEVTPPLTPGEAWTAERAEWFMAYHRSRRPGLAGPHQEITKAILCGAAPVGAVRLHLTDTVGVLETGIWLARPARGKGIARQVITLIIDEARRSGADAVRADTAESNTAAQALMQAAGFTLSAPTNSGRIIGLKGLRDTKVV